jgi:putative photosynthetic complex assembly protein 2
MEALALPFITAVAAWWFSTGAILWLIHHAKPSDRGVGWVAGGATVLAGAGVVWTAGMVDAGGAYLGFACALLIWGAIELTFLTGLITGPNHMHCPAQARGWRRFSLAAATLIHHEVLIALAAIAMIASTWGAPNQAAPVTFAVLAVMRISAKLNIFLGAPALSEEFMPARLAHLRSYFRRSQFNPVFPVSMLLGAVAAAFAAVAALAANADSAAQITAALAFALILLALLEHAFMMTPLDDAALWRWAARHHGDRTPPSPPPSPASPVRTDPKIVGMPP